MAVDTRQWYVFGPYRLDATDRLLFKNGELVALPPKVLDTLLLLVANNGHVLGKDEITKRLWPDTFVEEGTLSQYISLVRKALGDGGDWIENIPRRGYRFTAPVEDLPEIIAGPRNVTVTGEEAVTAKRRISRVRVVGAALALAGVIPAAALIWIGRKEKIPSAYGSVAVLPFRTVSDSGNDHLADGITEALITKLTNLKGLRVVSYSRVRRFKGSTVEAAETGRQLGVEAVIEGTVRVASGRMRLSVHAVDTKSGYTVWALDRLEADSASLLDVEDQLAEAAALRFRGRLTGEERGLIVKSATRNAEAYDLVLRARRAPRETAVRMLERAVQLDPGFANAYGWLAFVQHGIYKDGSGGMDMLRKAISNANQALSRDPNSLIAMRALVHIQHSAGREMEGLLMARRALESNPGDLDATAAAAEAYFRTGLYDRAIPLFKQALAEEPDSREFRTQLARMYLFLGEYEKGIEVISPLPPSEAGPFGMLLYAETGQKDKALEVLRSGLKKNPKNFVLSYFGGSMLAASGELAGAREVWVEGARNAEGLLERHESPYPHAFLAALNAELGKRDAARYHLDRSLASDPRHPIFLFFAIRSRFLLGERRQALESFKAAVENGFFNLPMLDYVTHPKYLSTLRNDPEFRSIRASLAGRLEELRARY
ncbi:MAG: tetratricopeptide repeat protein [Bryobacteraceae bacterium]